MFQDFAKRKFNDYLALLEFPAGRIQMSYVKNSSLPPFIISFFEYYVTKRTTPLSKKEFEEILNKAIIFNINYIIKPRNTILKFLFGDVETRPVHFVKERLKYFQFYGYYLTQIVDFINVNSLEVVSSNQIEHLIKEVNKKILEEITLPGDNSHRLNLVKLLYYFFHDLGDNNPINIKIPKKILSVYFQDKGYTDIKKRVDNFFSEEIFIQEAIEMMNPETKKSDKSKSDVGVSDKEMKEIVTKAKEKAKEKTKIELIDKESANKEVEKILQAEEKIPEVVETLNIEIIRQQEAKLPELEKNRLIIDDEIYSDDLMFAAQFNDLTPAAPLSDEEKRQRLIEDLFCEETYKKKIIKNVFDKDTSQFMGSVNYLLDKKDWREASLLIEEMFNRNGVDYFCEEAVKFVDIMQSHFVKDHIKRDTNKAI